MTEDFGYEYESIDDIARGEGFFIDDDGNWVPLEYAEEYGIELDEDTMDALDSWGRQDDDEYDDDDEEDDDCGDDGCDDSDDSYDGDDYEDDD